MPGELLSSFRNPLRFGQPPGIRVIDVLLDIILPEWGSIANRVDRPPIFSEEQFNAVRAGQFTDPEAEFVRNQTTRDLLPRTPFPYGGELFDVTWAFLQATGARPEQREIEAALAKGGGAVFDNATGTFRPPRADEESTHVIDPLTGQPVFPINALLPSLNRQPGIILVPAGLFPICGTIILFGGQQLVGVSAHGEGGSVLRKYGDGTCIRTQAPTMLSDDRHIRGDALRPTAAEEEDNLILDPGAPEEEWNRIIGLFDAFGTDEAGKYRDALRVTLPDEPAQAIPRDGSAWFEATPAVRRETMLRTLLASEFSGFASVRLRRLHIEQRNWGPLVARPPVEDELADPLRPVGYSHRVGGPRPMPLLHSSVGIDLVGCGLSIVEDVGIHGFRLGVGIRSVPRAIPAGSQFAYVNQVRHCFITDCHVGFLMGRRLGFGFLEDSGLEGENASRRGEQLVGSDAGPNSTVLFDCHVTASEVFNFPGQPWPRSGIELWGTCSVMFCSVNMPVPKPNQPGLGCIVNLSQQTTIYRCRLVGGPRHILCGPVVRFEPYFHDPEDDPKTEGIDIFIFDPTRLNLMRTSERVQGAQYLFYNRFFERSGAITAPRIEVVEFSANLGRFSTLRAYQRPPTPAAVAAIPMRLVDVSDERWERFAPQASLEVASEVRSLQTGWTSTNLLANVGFARPAAQQDNVPAPRWVWERADPPPTLPPRLVARHVDLAEPKFTGRAIEVSFRPFASSEIHLYFFRLRQVLVAQPGSRPPDGDAALVPWKKAVQEAWGARARFRGKRLVGGCWAHASVVDSVRVGFMEGDRIASQGRTIWRTGDWVFLSAVHPVRDLDQYDWSGYADSWEQGWFPYLGLSFFVQADFRAGPPLSVPMQPQLVRFGAAQVNLGPELFPLGPQPLSSDVYGDTMLKRGCSHSEVTTLATGQSQGSSLIGIPARLEKIFVDAEPSSEPKPSRFQVELLGAKTRRPLCEFNLALDGKSEMIKPLVEEVSLAPGDLVVTRLISGPSRAVDVYLQLVHSQVV